MKEIILIGLCILLVGCTEISPLDINVAVVGNPSTFHTDFGKGNNTINVTIKQEPSKLIFYPEDYTLIGTEPDFALKCYDDIYNLIFVVNLTKLWYTTDYTEKRIDENTIMKFAEIRDYSYFEPSTLNYTWRDFDCKIDSDFGLRYLEYIEGVLVQNNTIHCDWFWKRFEKIEISCELEGSCKYYMDNEAEEFIKYTSQYIMKRCYRDWTHYD